MSHRKSDLGIPRPQKSAKVVLVSLIEGRFLETILKAEQDVASRDCGS
jgi:hypothetical protein